MWRGFGINAVPESGGFEPAEIFRLFGRWPRASMFAAPTMIKRLLDAGDDCDPNNIRTIIWGGAPMYVAMRRARSIGSGHGLRRSTARVRAR